jgi:hypothetical protein
MNKATHDIVNKMNYENFIYLNQTLDEDYISKFYNTFANRRGTNANYV